MINSLKIDDANYENTIEKAAQLIGTGKIIALPFDTVYGFICDPKNESALKKVFELKKRPLTQTIGLAAASLESVKNFANLSEAQLSFIKAKMPGKFTFIVPIRKNAGLSKLCQKNNTVAIRIPNSQLVLDIANLFGGVIAQTSANMTNKPNCQSAQELISQFPSSELEKIDLIIDGGKTGDVASEIYDLTIKPFSRIR